MTTRPALTPRSLVLTMLAPIALGAALLAGCGEGTPRPTPNAALFSQTLFVPSIEEKPVAVTEAKAAAKEGETVTVHGHIGGRKDPFIAGRAVFTVVDTTLHPCKDCCNTPWDFCCDTQTDIATHAVTVQVVDESGAPIRSDINGLSGVAPGALVTITGTVAKRETASTLTLNATRIHVHGS